MVVDEAGPVFSSRALEIRLPVHVWMGCIYVYIHFACSAINTVRSPFSGSREVVKASVVMMFTDRKDQIMRHGGGGGSMHGHTTGAHH